MSFKQWVDDLRNAVSLVKMIYHLNCSMQYRKSLESLKWSLTSYLKMIALGLWKPYPFFFSVFFAPGGQAERMHWTCGQKGALHGWTHPTQVATIWARNSRTSQERHQLLAKWKGGSVHQLHVRTPLVVSVCWSGIGFTARLSTSFCVDFYHF